MAYDPILAGEVDAKSPIDVNLMTNKIKEDFDDHEARLLALEGGGGSGGGSSSSNDPRYGSIIGGLQTNEPVFWRKKYSFLETVLASGEKYSGDLGFDPDNSEQSRWIGFEEPYDASSFDTVADSASAYRGYFCLIPDGKTFSFKLKKGENFFGLGAVKVTTGPSAITVKIDGQSLTSLGITDEAGVARADDFASTSSIDSYSCEWFFGLRGDREHTISVTNNDGGGANLDMEYIEIGYATPQSEYTVDHTITAKAGRALVRGISVTTDEEILDVTPSNGYGHTAALVADTAGDLTIIDGVEPAMTQALPEIAIPFGSGPVTSIKVKNSKLFPSSGFLLVSTPWGMHQIASYTGKTETLINQHTFTGMIWQSQPTIDITPLSGIESDTPGDSTGDLSFNLWAAGGHLVSSSNNKLDFKVTLNGTQTTHAATIANGLYSADLVPLGQAIIEAMQAVKPLTNGDYFCEYNMESMRWSIGIKGQEVSELQLLFNSGSNVANSIHTTIGFGSTDLTGATSYFATTDKQSLAHRVFRKDSQLMAAGDPRIQFSAISSNSTGDIEKRMGLGYVYLNVASQVMKIYPDDDATGLSFSFLCVNDGAPIMAQVDYGQYFYVLQTSNRLGDDQVTRAQVMTGFISFPRGSRVITLTSIDLYGMMQIVSTPGMYFVGAQQYYTKPREEALTVTQSIIKSFDIAPKQLFKTPYAYDYSPQASKDNVDTVVYTGSWSGGSHTEQYNGSRNFNSTPGDYVDYTFTLAGDGGGFSVMLGKASACVRKIGFFLVSGPTGSETSSRIQNIRTEWGGLVGDVTEDEAFEIYGLPAGQYTLRMKHEGFAAEQLHTSSFRVIDTIEPDRGSTVSDVTNTGQGVTYPINLIKHSCHLDQLDKVPIWLRKSGYREGHSVIDSQFSTFTQDSHNDSGEIKNQQDYFGAFFLNRDVDHIRSFNFAKSVCTLDGMFTTLNTDLNPVLDGRNPAFKYSQRVCTKGGSAPSAFREVYFPPYSRHVREYASGNMSNSTTFLISNTRGFKVGHTVIVEADSQPTLKRVIASITTDTNIVFTEAISGFANYTTANNALVRAYGFHSIKTQVDADSLYAEFSAICFEPMDVLPSKHDLRRMAKSKAGEIAVVNFYDVQNGDDLYYPYFSDGVQATAKESVIQITGAYSASDDVNWQFAYDLKNVYVDGTSPQLWVKITSIRSN